MEQNPPTKRRMRPRKVEKQNNSIAKEGEPIGRSEERRGRGFQGWRRARYIGGKVDKKIKKIHGKSRKQTENHCFLMVGNEKVEKN